MTADSNVKETKNAMFSQPPDDNSQSQAQNNKTVQNNPRRRRKKRFSNKKKQFGVKDVTKRKQSPFADTMSSWAESFATAATWQLKHQIAYWKSKAKALEYENKILHDIIKKNYLKTTPLDLSVNVEESSVKSDIADQSELEEDGEEGENENFEVSEEFIQFLTANAKYKEDARREREKLKAKQDAEENTIGYSEAIPSENTEENLKELYGRDWQRIAALEMTVQGNFINEIDKDRPMHWPNIPFNFNFDH